MTQTLDPQHQARPAGVSACLIVRDEERFLPECLASIRPFIDEICLVDTGSRDRTVEIARSFGAKVSHLPWTGDFSAARNASLQMATWPWILVIDADEVLDPRTGPDLRRVITTPGAPLAYLVQREDQFGAGQTSTLAVPRLFRNHLEIRFSRPVHEDISESLAALGAATLPQSGVRLLHRGFLPEVYEARGKAARNLAILRERVSQVPDDLFSTWQLGVALSRPEQGTERFGAYSAAYQLAENLAPEARMSRPYLPLVYSGYAAGLTERGELNRALQVVAQGLSAFPGNVDLCYRQGDLLRRIGDFTGAEKLLRACLGAERASLLYAGDPAVRGTLPAIGLCLIALESGDGGPRGAALRLAEQALALDPHHLDARCTQARALIASGAINQVKDRFLDLTTQAPNAPQVQALAGEVAWMQQDRALAMDLWRSALGGALRPEEAPDAVHDARAQLAIGELVQGNHEAALLHLPLLIARDLSGAACRVLLCAVAGVTVSLDPAFRVDGVLRHVRFWLRELAAAGRWDALEGFMRNAPRYAERLPGIADLVRAD
jgi:tetratricopeptide (TPR) repeat protein